MKLDRSLQLKILHLLADAHPVGVYFLDCADLAALHEDESVLWSNVLYLEDHGLLRSGLQYVDMPGMQCHSESAPTFITAKGLDFLADDGGLGAILGVVTIKLHDDTIRELITLRIQNSDLPPAEKQTLIDQLRDLRGESIKHLTMKLLDAGLENWPAAMLAIQTALAAVR